MGKEKQLRVGLIGLGRMGQNHLRVLSRMDPVQVAFIYDQDWDKTCLLAQEYGVRGTDDPEKSLSEVDAAIIATPTTTHAEYIVLAARHTPHLFVEKPLTDTLESTLSVAEVARSRDLQIQVGFIERFNPVVAGLKHVAALSPAVVSMDFVRTDKVPDRNLDVDVVLDLMIHDLDLALFLRGPVVQAVGYGHSSKGTTALAHALLVHENGTLTRILSSKMTHKRQRTASITCPDLFAEADLLRRELVVLPESALSEPLPAPPPDEGPLLAQLLAFVASCRGDSCPGSYLIPTLEDAASAMSLAEAIRQSIARNQRAVV
jgi:predicted dehydrogenase